MTYGSNTRKTLQTLRKLFLKPIILLPSTTYKPFYVTKVYKLKGINKSLLHSLYTIQYIKKNQIKWTKEEILDQVKATKELFASSKLNRIASLIPNLLNQIHPTDPNSFRANLTSQNIPYSQATDHNTPINQNTDQITPII